MGNRKKSSKVKKKLEIVFDPKARREFLTGFRKRKNERRKRAKEELERLLKEENKRMKEEIKSGIQKQLKRSYEPLPEAEEILRDEEIEHGHAIVTIKEVSMKELTEKENLLGENCPKSNNNDDNNSVINDSVEENNYKEGENEGVPGMNFHIEENIQKNSDYEGTNIKTKKDINKMKQKQMMSYMRHSKFFKIKQNYDRITNKKMARKDRNKQLKQLKRGGKKNPKKFIEKQNAKRKERGNKHNKRHK